MNYTLSKPDNDKSMYDLLSGNHFQIIAQNTTSSIVPYEEGKDVYYVYSS